MVSPTQSVPEVLAVWGSDYKIAIVCRRYTIMVAQIHHLKPHQNPHQKSLSTTLPLSRTSGTLLCVGGFVTPHSRYLRHRLCGANHNRVSPTRCSFHSPPHRPTARHSHNPHHKLTPLDSRPLTLDSRTSFLVPRPSYLLPLTSYPTEHKKGAAPCGTAPYTHIDS